MRNRFQQFMYGRYGMDQLNRFLSTVALIILVVSMFIRRPIVEIVALALLFWCYYRMFSKNISKRAAEEPVVLQVLHRSRRSGKHIMSRKRFIVFLHVRTVRRRCVCRKEKEKSVLPVRNAIQSL